MKDYLQNVVKKEGQEIGGLAVIILIGFIIIGAGFFFVVRSINHSQEETKTLAGRLDNLEAVLATTTLTSEELAARLKDQQEKTKNFEDTIDDISGTVNKLDKLSKTDQELLQKYSRVYFLSDNYVPLRLKNIENKYLYDKTKTLQFHASAISSLDDMLDAAADDDIDLSIVSAYRSFGTQSSLKSNYLVTYGSGSNQFSADQGYSEHQLGTAVDLALVASPATVLMISFEATPAFTWLSKNAYKYGFVLSYPKGNVYYQYEPWHWRFVGVKLATRLYRDGINFSDMDQRDIDKYLVNIFD